MNELPILSNFFLNRNNFQFSKIKILYIKQYLDFMNTSYYIIFYLKTFTNCISYYKSNIRLIITAIETFYIVKNKKLN